MNKGYRKFFALLSLMVLLLGLAAVNPVSAQLISGNLVGTVLDKTGAVVPNATVEAVNTQTGAKYETKANGAGEYRFNNLAVGTYNISASAPNLATTTVNGYLVELNMTKSLSITLEIKGAVTTVEVTGVAEALDTTTSTLATTFDPKMNADLPSTTLGPSGILNLSLLSSGVASSGGIGAGSGPSIGGQRPRNNNFTVEGIDNNSKSVTGPLVPIPNDSIAEFTVLQNQYSPEFGHSSGGQFNFVLKSGTNSFHGLAYIYSQNRNFNAMDQATKNNRFTSNQRYDNNRFGGNIGGPILKNKLFFFGSGQYNPVGQASVPGAPVCTPTAAGYTALGGISGVSATNLTVFKTYATPAPSGSNCPTAPSFTPDGKFANLSKKLDATHPASPECPQFGCFYITDPSVAAGYSAVDNGILPVAAPNYNNGKTFMGKIDYDISSKDQIRGSYIYNDFFAIDATPSLPAFFLPNPANINRLITVNEYHTFNSSLSNELRLGFNRSYSRTSTGNFKFPGLDSFPDLLFDELNTLQLGPDPNGPQFGYQNVYQATDNVTWTKGHHNFKFGIEGRKYISPQSFTQRSRGDYEYSSMDRYFRDLNPDLLAERSNGNPVYYGDQTALYWFANDDWRIRPNLTLNLGVRYEYMTIPFGERSQKLNQAASIPGLVDFSEPRAPKNNWGPRIGIAYSPGSSGTTSIRAGFGISYDVLYDNIGILSLPPQLSGTIDTPFTPDIPNYLGNGGIKPGAGGLRSFDAGSPAGVDCVAKGVAPGVPCQIFNTGNHIVVNQLSPKSIQWTLGVQHVFYKDYTVELRYVGTRGIHLNTQERINRSTLTTSTVGLPTYTANPGLAALDALPYTAAGIAAGAYGNGDSLVPAFENAGFFGANLVQFTPNGDSNYHGLAEQVTRRMANGLTFVQSYTYSHTIDNSTADFFTSVLTPRRGQDFQNLAADRSNSALDRRHRFTLAAIYDLPSFKNGNWLKKNVLGNWEAGPIYTYQSPEWMTVQSSRDVNGNGDTAGDRAVFNPKGTPGLSSDVTALPNSAGATVAYLANNSNAQYIRAGAFAFMNLGRNTLPARHINNLDFTALKRFSLTEGKKIEFSAQALNVLNHPQFVPGSLNDVQSLGYTGSRTFLQPGNGEFNNPETVFPSNARALQLALKFIF
ncbi:MAG TPA: carboxypeptidase regulatory-like domain-containing protein [Candidatus Limnocylindria bacterium]|nr:carboxypeptidase regulatory-like domain-containing protein [Candidatus Limnocylindria bacterium]